MLDSISFKCTTAGTKERIRIAIKNKMIRAKPLSVKSTSFVEALTFLHTIYLKNVWRAKTKN